MLDDAAEGEQGARCGWVGGLLLILLLAFGLRVYRLDHQSLWWDEMHAGAMAVLPPGAILDNLFAVRNHVPLYFFLIRLWSWLGRIEFTLRFFSVVWGVVSVALIYRLGHLVGGRRVGVVAAFLLAISPLHIWYSQEARMYTMVATCTLAASWFLLCLLQHDSRAAWVGYGVCMLAAVYTHYLALFVLLAHYAFFALHFRLVKRVFVKWLACSLVVAALFGIWGAMILFSGGVSGAPIGWIAPARWYEPLLTLLTFAVGPTISLGQPLVYLSLGVCLAAICVCLARARRHWFSLRLSPPTLSDPNVQRRVGGILAPRLLFSWLIVPLLLIWLISLDLPIPQKRSIYMDRYLITTLPAFVVLVAWGLVFIFNRKRWLAIASLTVVILAAVLALNNLYFDPLYAREDWRAAMAYLDMERQPGDVLLLRPSHTLPLFYYTDGSASYQEFPFLFDKGEREAYLTQEMESKMATIAQEWDRAWLISSVDNTNPHGFPHERNTALKRVEKEDAIRVWLDRCYVQLGEFFFTGVHLTLYDLSPMSGG